MKDAKEQYNFGGYYGLLVHDPQNLKIIDKDELLSLFDKLRNNDLVIKIGISAYDLNDIENFRKIIDPELIQIPFNPINQTFINDEFIDYVEQKEIEVHARSLFLQGVLLSDKLPEFLNDLEPLWCLYMEATKSFKSRLDALLSWAFTHKWVSKWILGVSCKQDLLGIIESKSQEVAHSFFALKGIVHPMADPRNWKII
jgi:aryl-alcohol dehydrogenase-like predicted oxidoreductase